MKTKVLAAVTAMAAGLLMGGCDSPFKDDGESSEAEDSAAIATYTQTVNQASQDTTISVQPDVDIDGNNNSVVIIYGDDNAPSNDNAHDEIVAQDEPAVTEEP